MRREARGLVREGGHAFIAGWWGLLRSTVFLVATALLLAGCPKKPDVQAGAPAAAGGPATEVKKPEPMVEAPVKPGPKPVEGQLKDVFFDFDKATLRDDTKKTLDENIQWLKTNPGDRIMVEGHCDERGTNEYNLALGERRAKAVRDYLAAGGIDAKRISTISYGEERPFVLGHDESAWKWNRRGHFVVVK
jgi:peptidoglycan-associated lipoprotein